MKVMVIGIKNSQLKNIRPYSKDIINNLKKSHTWEIQSTNNFISSTDNQQITLFLPQIIIKTVQCIQKHWNHN